MRDPEDPVKDAAPGIVLRAKKMDPAVKSGNSDLPVITKIRHSIRTVKICEQDGKYKSQGIGSEGDERIREKGMRAAAGAAPEPGDNEFGVRTGAMLGGDHEPPVGADPGESADSAAFRTSAGGGFKTGNSSIKELPVRIMQLV